jgi:hypothetical protein
MTLQEKGFNSVTFLNTEAFSTALDERMDVSDTTQLTAFIRVYDLEVRFL